MLDSANVSVCDVELLHLIKKWRHFVSPKTWLHFRVRVRVRVRVRTRVRQHSHFCEFDGDSTANALRIGSQFIRRGSHWIRRDFTELGEYNATVWRFQNESHSFYHCEMKKLTACTVKMRQNSYSVVFFAQINKRFKTLHEYCSL